MSRWRVSLELVLRTCSVVPSGYPTMWENFYIVGALTLTMGEYSHIVEAIAQPRELPHAFPVFSFMGGLWTHVLQVFTLMGWLAMYGKSSHQSFKLHVLFCGCCCSKAHSVLMAPYGVPHECMIRWRLSWELVLRTCSVERHAGYPTMWENFHIVGALTPAIREYFHMVFPSYIMRNSLMSSQSSHSWEEF